VTVFPISMKRSKNEKARLIKQIVDGLRESLGILEKAARASHAEATHESSKAESKYDTRGLEAAYLAGGQARQAKEILDSIKLYEALTTRDFAADEPIDLTALVELDTDDTRSIYFIGPKNGGLEIRHHGKEIMVITPQSPLGQNLMGKKAGQRWTAKLGGSIVKYHVFSVV
jgi:transcription elongation GreA/GreB family factor